MRQVPRDRALCPVIEGQAICEGASEPGHTVMHRDTCSLNPLLCLTAPRAAAQFGRKIRLIPQDSSTRELCHEASMHIHVKMG